MTTPRERRFPRLALALALLALAAGAACIVYVPVEDQPGYDSGRSAYDRGDRWDYSNFYDDLAPYGRWTRLSPYGYVWLPFAARDFGWRPYTRGRWVWTDYGWMFVSRDPWGWAAWHYGRWGFDPRLGWFWVPGSVWAPAWVAWRWGGTAIGWAPLPPGWDFDRHDDWRIDDDRWIFVSGRRFDADDVHDWILPRERARGLIRTTVSRGQLKARGSAVENPGVDPDFVREAVRHEITMRRLEDADRPGEPRLDADRVTVFRKELRDGGAGLRPRRVISLEEVREAGRGDGRILDDEQDRERRALEADQDEEVRELERRSEQEKKSAVTERDRKRIDEETKVKAGELKRKHEDEKKKVESRQAEEKKEIKGTIRKKD